MLAKKISLIGVCLVVAVFNSGCITHKVAFGDFDYPVQTKMPGVGVVAVIAPETLKKNFRIHSALAGYANVWEVQPGQMLQQFMEVVLPQVFDSGEVSPVKMMPKQGARKFGLELSIPEYRFADYHATITVDAKVSDESDEPVLEKEYTHEGPSQGAKMFNAGALGMKSALRQSTLGAYKLIFDDLMLDLKSTLETREKNDTQAK